MLQSLCFHLTLFLSTVSSHVLMQCPESLPSYQNRVLFFPKGALRSCRTRNVKINQEIWERSPKCLIATHESNSQFWETVPFFYTNCPIALAILYVFVTWQPPAVRKTSSHSTKFTKRLFSRFSKFSGLHLRVLPTNVFEIPNVTRWVWSTSIRLALTIDFLHLARETTRPETTKYASTCRGSPCSGIFIPFHRPFPTTLADCSGKLPTTQNRTFILREMPRSFLVFFFFFFFLDRILAVVLHPVAHSDYIRLGMRATRVKRKREREEGRDEVECCAGKRRERKARKREESRNRYRN